MATVRRSFLISLAESYTGLVISFLSTLFLARLLSPTEIGTFSVGVVLVGIAHIVRDFGVGRYIIQEPELTVDRLRAAFLVTLVLAWGLAALLAVASVPASEFYNTPGVRSVMLVLACNFLLLPFGSITMACLRREMNFAAAFRIKTSSSLVHAFTGVGLAFLGFSYMSLAWAAMAGVITTVIGCAYYRPKDLPWLPGTKELRRVLSFGSYASGASIVAEIGTSAPDLLIGKILNIGSVAIFGRATGLIELFNRMVANSIWSVAMPHFASQLRSGKDLHRGYLRVVHYITGIAWPFYGFMALLAYPIVHLLFGSQWDASVPLLRVLCLAAMLTNFNMVSGEFILACGEAKALAKISTTAVLLKVAAIAVASSFGLLAIAIAVTMASMVSAILPLTTLRRLAGIKVGDLLVATRGSLGVALLSLTGPAVLLAVFGLEPRNLWLAMISSAIIAALGWFAGLFLFRHQLAGEVVTILGKAKSLLRLGGDQT
jgi:O-antigen/teichoic acid export membrane protein